MKNLATLFTVIALAVTSSVANADLLTFDNGGAGWDFDENNPVSVAFDFPPNGTDDPVAIVSIEVSMSHTWSGDVDFTVSGPGGAFYHLMDNQGGSTDLGGVYTFVETGGAAAGTYAAGGPGTYDANSWSAGSFAKDGWRFDFLDTAGGDAGFIDYVTINFNKVPAPGAMALLGIAGLVGRRRRR